MTGQLVSGWECLHVVMADMEMEMEEKCLLTVTARNGLISALSSQCRTLKHTCLTINPHRCVCVPYLCVTSSFDHRCVVERHVTVTMFNFTTELLI